MKSRVKSIKKIMMDALELPVKQPGIRGLVLTGDYVCHDDIPDETPIGFDTHFTVTGKDETKAYLVLIQEVDL